MVCSRPHFVSRVEKKCMLLKYIDGNIDIIDHISQYSCMQLPSTSIHYMTTRLQYKTLKFLRAISSIIRKLSLRHSINTSFSSDRYICGPLNCQQRSHFFINMCREIKRNSYLVGEHFLEIDAEENAWREEFDETIYLMYRINRSLWAYCLRYHPCHCKDC